MALDSAIYLVTKEIAMRSGVINSRYRVADGRFILSNKDLALVRLTSDEYVNGLQGVELISEAESQRLIAENHFQRGLNNVAYKENNVEPQVQEQEEQVVDNEPNADVSSQENDDTQDDSETTESVETVSEETNDEESDIVNENNNEQTQVEEE